MRRSSNQPLRLSIPPTCSSFPACPKTQKQSFEWPDFSSLKVRKSSSTCRVPPIKMREYNRLISRSVKPNEPRTNASRLSAEILVCAAFPTPSTMHSRRLHPAVEHQNGHIFGQLSRNRDAVRQHAQGLLFRTHQAHKSTCESRSVSRVRIDVTKNKLQILQRIQWPAEPDPLVSFTSVPSKEIKPWVRVH